MVLYIELLVLYIVLGIFIIWRLWLVWSTWRLQKKYKPENDKARKGGVAESGGREKGIAETTSSVLRLDEPSTGTILQTTTVDNTGEPVGNSKRVSGRNKKNGRSPRSRLLRRRR